MLKFTDIRNPLGLYSLNQLSTLKHITVNEDKVVQPWVVEVENNCPRHTGKAAIFEQQFLSPQKVC